MTKGQALISVSIGALVVGVVGAVLDWHGHQCDACGHRWRHLGKFAVGNADKHTCARCGTMQWWKCGVPPEVRALHAAYVPAAPPPMPRMRQVDTRGAY